LARGLNEASGIKVGDAGGMIPVELTPLEGTPLRWGIAGSIVLGEPFTLEVRSDSIGNMEELTLVVKYSFTAEA